MKYSDETPFEKYMREAGYELERVDLLKESRMKNPQGKFEERWPNLKKYALNLFSKCDILVEDDPEWGNYMIYPIEIQEMNLTESFIKKNWDGESIYLHKRINADPTKEFKENIIKSIISDLVNFKDLGCTNPFIEIK